MINDFYHFCINMSDNDLIICTESNPFSETAKLWFAPANDLDDDEISSYLQSFKGVDLMSLCAQDIHSKCDVNFDTGRIMNIIDNDDGSRNFVAKFYGNENSFAAMYRIERIGNYEFALTCVSYGPSRANSPITW